jgi:hypothetical protein
MQILPSTGKDKNIGIRNVHLLENHIHAGVKYLAFLKNCFDLKSQFSGQAVKGEKKMT